METICSLECLHNQLFRCCAAGSGSRFQYLTFLFVDESVIYLDYKKMGTDCYNMTRENKIDDYLYWTGEICCFIGCLFGGRCGWT